MIRHRTHALIAVTLLALAGGARAHHSFAMYDNNKYVPLTGTVKTYVWKNPHVMIDYAVTAPDGSTQLWALEGSSPNILGRRGWTPTSIKVGDKVPVVLHPMKDGRNYALIVSATTPAGAVLKDKE